MSNQLPPLLSVRDPALVRVFQAVYDSLSTQGVAESVTTNTIVRTYVSQQAQAAATAETNKLRNEMAQLKVTMPSSDSIVRDVVESSGLERPLEINQPVLFRAGTASRGVFIGSGGIGGMNEGQATFAMSSADGSFFFGPQGDASRQIAFTPGLAGDYGAFVIGSKIVVVDETGNPREIGYIASSAINAASMATAAMNSVGDKLNKVGGDILSGSIKFSSSGGFITDGMTVNSNGDSSGQGVAITSKGIVARSTSGVTFTLDSASGNALFAGDIETPGHIIAHGAYNSGGVQASIIGHADTSGVYSIYGRAPDAGTAAAYFNNTYGGTAILTYGDVVVTGDVRPSRLVLGGGNILNSDLSGYLTYNGAKVITNAYAPTGFTASVTDLGGGMVQVSGIAWSFA